MDNIIELVNKIYIERHKLKMLWFEINKIQEKAKKQDEDDEDGLDDQNDDEDEESKDPEKLEQEELKR